MPCDLDIAREYGRLKKRLAPTDYRGGFGGGGGGGLGGGGAGLGIGGHVFSVLVATQTLWSFS